MKSCAMCNGRKVNFLRDRDTLKITVECSKCGQALHTPYLTLDSAGGAWNTKQAELEKTIKSREAAAS